MNIQSRKCRAVIRHPAECGGSLLVGPRSAKHPEHWSMPKSASADSDSLYRSMGAYMHLHHASQLLRLIRRHRRHKPCSNTLHGN